MSAVVTVVTDPLDDRLRRKLLDLECTLYDARRMAVDATAIAVASGCDCVAGKPDAHSLTCLVRQVDHLGKLLSALIDEVEILESLRRVPERNEQTEEGV